MGRNGSCGRAQEPWGGGMHPQQESHGLYRSANTRAAAPNGSCHTTRLNAGKEFAGHASVAGVLQADKHIV